MISRRAFAMVVPMAAVSVRRLRAAGVDGKWKAEIENPRGTQVMMFDLKSDGDSLTGTVGNDRVQFEIKDGRISGDEVSFVQTVMRGEMEFRFQFQGKVMGDEMQLTRTAQRPAGAPGGGRGPGGGRPPGGRGGGQRPAGGQGGARGQGPGGARRGGGQGRGVTIVAKRVQ